jgi:hypothetical protein
MTPMTEAEARYLARRYNYSARYLGGQWMVWDDEHDDEVVFDLDDYRDARDITSRRKRR